MMEYMRRQRPYLLTTLAVIAACLASCLCYALDGRLQGKVVHVRDGDLIVVRTVEGSRMEVRLAYIDAPEVGGGKGRAHGRSTAGQPFGEKAREALKAKVLKKRVELQVVDVDRYGRSVAIVSMRGRDVNLEMVREGYAWAYRSRLRTPYASIYLDAEEEARGKKLNLWKQANPQPPWEFRRKARGAPRAVIVQ